MKIGRLIVIGLVLVMAVIAAGTVQAETRPGAFTVTPFLGSYVFDRDQNLDGGLTYGLGFGYQFTSNWAAEATFNFINTASQAGGGDVLGHLYRVDALYHFNFSKTWVPYLAAGFGGMNLDPDVGDSDSDTVFNWGGGLKYFLTDDLALRGDLRHVRPFGDPADNLALTFGVAYQFGGAPKAIPTPPPCADSDQDGVCDDDDKCPGTPAGVKVGPDGCCLDSDQDGVCDDDDKCPGTPAGVKVGPDGCCLDSDQDGVCDEQDKCPDTPAGAKVDTDGCPIILKEQVSIELKVEFDFDKADVKPQYHDELKKVADFMKQYIYTQAVIEGHTDSKGSDKYNVKLSQRRADSVCKYLIANFGLAPERLIPKGYGESRPVATNDTDEGRQKNRRVVAVISAVEEKMLKKTKK